MGLTPGIGVRVRKVAPMGDPIQIELRGYELTLRLDDARFALIGSVESLPQDARSRRTVAPRVRASRHRRGERDRGRLHPQPWQAPAQGRAYHLCARRQPKLRQDHAVQPAHWRKSACWQFPWCHCRQEGGPAAPSSRGDGGRPSRRLLALAVLERGGRDARLPDQGEAHRDHQHRRRDQHRAQPLSHVAVDGDSTSRWCSRST